MRELAPLTLPCVFASCSGRLELLGFVGKLAEYLCTRCGVHAARPIGAEEHPD